MQKSNGEAANVKTGTEREPSSDERFMREALRQARKAAALGEVPVGCVIVCEGQIIARGYNRREIDKSALAHAELRAIGKACRRLGGWRLWQCDLYVTLEPCLMFAGAIFNARVRRVVYGAADDKTGAMGGRFAVQQAAGQYQPEVAGGVCEAECRALLKSFFAEMREKRAAEAKNRQNQGQPDGEIKPQQTEP